MNYQDYIDMALIDNGELKLILKGEICNDDQQKMGVVSVVFITKDINAAKTTLANLNDHKNKDDYFMLYSCPTDINLSELSHFPSLQITKADLE